MAGLFFPAHRQSGEKSDNLLFWNTDWAFQNKKHYL